MEKENEPPDHIMCKLYPYQQEHIRAMGKCVDENSAILEASDTGTGKTAIICALSAWKNYSIFVICPKPVVSTWFKFAAMFGIHVIGVSNYEAIKQGKYYTSVEEFNAENRQTCPYVKFKRVGNRVVFEIALPPCMFVIDEAHRGKNYSTDNSKLLIAIKESFDIGRANRPEIRCKIAILSATIAQTIEEFRTTSYILGITQFGKHAFAAWKRQILAQYPDGTEASAIHRVLFPKYGHRMCKSNITEREQASTNQNVFHVYKWLVSLDHGTGYSPYMDVFSVILNAYNTGTTFKHSDIKAEVYEVSADVEQQIVAAYQDINAAIEAIKNKQMGEVHPLTIILRARQRIEMLKVHVMINLATEFLMDGYAVTIFVNFTPTIDKLYDALTDFVTADFNSCITFIQGGQSVSDRTINIDMFQSGKSDLMLVNVEAGGLGISLHRTNWNAKPRAVIISPPWSAITLKQVLGRADRAGSLSDSVQRIIYCRGNVSGVNGNDTTFPKPEGGGQIGIEELMAIKINRKLRTIELLNNGDDKSLLEI